MRLVTYNIQWGKGKDGRIDLARIAGTVDGADLIALQEVERHWRRSGHADQVRTLAQLLPRYYWVYGPALDLDASIVHGDRVVENRRRQFGNMLLARNRILSARVLPLRKLPSGDVVSMQMAALEAVVALGGGACRVVNVHLGDVLQRERLLQIEDLRRILEAGPQQGGVVTGRVTESDLYADEDWLNGEAPPPMPDSAILLGDFNATPDSPEYDALVGAPDPCRGRTATPDRLVDAMTAAGHGEDCGATWHPQRAGESQPAGRLDYCFLTPDLAAAVRRAWIDHAADGSDHQPVWVEIDL